MLPERFWKRFNKTICKLFRAGAGYFRTVRKCVKGGYSLSRKRVSPFATPERKDEGPSPSTPHIARLQLEELHALRNVSAVYIGFAMNLCDSLPIATAPYSVRRE